ncbi:MAG: tetratricopeptide repeat protein, partial [Myxococcota bacterium]
MRWWLRAGLTRVLTHAASAALLALILFPPAEASAQLRKSGRKGVLKPPPRAGDAPKKRRKGAASLEVETALDRKAVARGRAADAKRNEAIEELQKLIPVASESRKPEMTFRLAELYWEKSKYEYTLEMEAFEAAHAEWRDAGSPGRPPKRRVFLRQSERIKTTALRLYERVLKTSPTYPRNDEVLFYLGYNEYEAGNARRAVAHYWRLIKQFPESKLKAQAYLQLGEHFFNSNDVRRAQSAYERALATGEAQIANYARYKLAWCDYNVEDYDAGISKLKKVIDVSDAAGDSRAIELKSEALRDLARFFSFEGEVETAFEYFQEKGGEAIAQRYSAELAALFHGQGEWDLEIDTYRLLLDTYPMDERAPYYQASIVEALGKKSARRAIRVEVERLIDFYRPGTPWYRAQTDRGEAGDAAVEYAYDLMETKLRDMVTEYHRDAQKRKDARTYRLARDIYAKYLEAFPETESAFRMRYYYAEVLWALDEWGEAAGAYKAVASASTRRRTDKALARQAAYNQVVAWEKVARTGKMSGASRRKRRVVEKKNKG